MISQIILVLAASGLGVVFVSLLVERLRRHPDAPTALSWGPHLSVHYVSVNGHEMRYVKTGDGPALILLHTMRTQLDIYQKMIAELAERFTVYAPDLPAHGWSDIPREPVSVELLTESVAGFLEALEIKDAIVAGQSIGANIPLLLAADGHPAIRAVVAINTFDYGRRWSVRGSLLLRILFTLGPVPIIGTTFLRLRNRFIEAALFKGGVADPKSIPPALLNDMMLAGHQRDHYRQFHYLLRLIERWPAIHARYADIAVPVLNRCSKNSIK